MGNSSMGKVQARMLCERRRWSAKISMKEQAFFICMEVLTSRKVKDILVSDFTMHFCSGLKKYPRQANSSK